VSGQARGASGHVTGDHAVLGRLCWLNGLDITLALAVALVVNVSVLLVSAATFHTQGTQQQQAWHQAADVWGEAPYLINLEQASSCVLHACNLAATCVVVQGSLSTHSRKRTM
jgi:Mn2+/Fe2+ NRAMP family transporter